jgi:hypothetical protein
VKRLESSPASHWGCRGRVGVSGESCLSYGISLDFNDSHLEFESDGILTLDCYQF